MTVELPDRAQVIVVGGGIIGASIAYHLTKEACRTFCFRAGAADRWHHLACRRFSLPTQINHSLTKLATYSTRLFKSWRMKLVKRRCIGLRGQFRLHRILNVGKRCVEEFRWRQPLGSMLREIGMDELNEKVPLYEQTIGRRPVHS